MRWIRLGPRGELTFEVVNQSNPERDALIQRGLFGSAGRLHKMELDGTSDANFARYKCRRCSATFAVGYKAVVGQGPGHQRLELIDRTSLDRPCAGMLIVHGELRSEASRDAEAVVAVANELAKHNADWEVEVAERAPSASRELPLVAISWNWQSQDPSASVEQAMDLFAKVFAGLFPGRPISHIIWTSRHC